MATLPFYKDADEVRVYSIDWGATLDASGSPSDTISTSTWFLPSESPTSLVKDSDSKTADETFITLSGGEAGRSYRIVNRIATTDGETHERDIVISVNDADAALFDTSFVVEDGTPLTNSNSYVTVAEADAYHTLRGNGDWLDATKQTKQSALVKATFYLIQKYRMRWKGIRVDRNQSLDWPRAGVISEDFFNPQTDPRPALYPKLAFEIPETEIPTEVKQATYEIALRIAQGTDPNPDVSSGGDIRSIQAGPVEIEYFGQGGSAEKTIEFPVVDGLVRPLLRIGRGIVRG